MKKKVTYEVHDKKGKEVGSIELDPSVFEAPIMPELVHQAVRWQRARARAGTHSTLTRSEMKGGGKKPFKQKGTGRARAGSNISSIWVGGAVVFGPKPRDYDFRLPKRARRQAMTSMLSDKVSSKTLRVIDELSAKAPKTKDMVKMFAGIGCAERPALVVLSDEGENVEKSLRNIPGVKVIPVAGMNVYDLVKYEYLVSTKAGIQAITDRLSKSDAA